MSIVTPYEDLLRFVLETGTPKSDRTGTGTRSLFGQQMRYDLSAGFPLLTTKKVHFKSVAYELLWFLRGDSNIGWLHEHGVTIWDEWASDTGELGPIYGVQWRSWPAPSGEHIDQISAALDLLRTDPDSRRIIVSAWNVGEIERMALPPCHAFFQFYVADGRLSCQLYQRSADLFLGVPFNIASYALLTHMMAAQAGLSVGEFIWTGGDCHIYDNHVEQVRSTGVDPAAQLHVLRRPLRGTGQSPRHPPADRGPASAPGARADLPHRVRLVAAGAKVSAVAETAPLRVQLIAKTDFLAPPDVPWTTDADGGPALVEFAGRACYQSWSKPNPKTATNAGYLRHIIDVGHFSVLEHASVSFYITGISRSCTHELIRHRHFSYSQLSQRYVPEKDSRVVVPPGMEDDADLRHILTEAADAARATYSELLAKLEAKFADQPNAILRRKQARQAARAVLPNATETRIVVTGNYRAWRHFIAMRASEHADVEIRRLAIECLRQLAAVAPAVFADFEVTTLADGTEVATSPLATEA